MGGITTWPRATLIALGVLLLTAIVGWAMALDRGNRLGEAAEREQRLTQQVAGLESSLTSERAVSVCR